MFGVATLRFCSPLLTVDISIDTLSKYLSRLEHLNSVSRGRPLVQGTFEFDSLICIGNCLLNLYCENAANRLSHARYRQFGMNEESVAALKSPCSSVPLLPFRLRQQQFPALLCCCNIYDRHISVVFKVY